MNFDWLLITLGEVRTRLKQGGRRGGGGRGVEGRGGGRRRRKGESLEKEEKEEKEEEEEGITKCHVKMTLAFSNSLIV